MVSAVFRAFFFSFELKHCCLKQNVVWDSVPYKATMLAALSNNIACQMFRKVRSIFEICRKMCIFKSTFFKLISYICCWVLFKLFAELFWKSKQKITCLISTAKHKCEFFILMSNFLNLFIFQKKNIVFCLHFTRTLLNEHIFKHPALINYHHSNRLN